MESAGARAAVEELPDPEREPRNAPVAVTGAAGFVGTHVCAALVRAGWPVRALVHSERKAAVRIAHLDVQIASGDIRDAGFLRDAFDGARTVVHLAAIAIERAGSTFESVNSEGTASVVRAAADARAERIVHMSQNGADSRSRSRFLRSKGVAEEIVTASTLRWTVLRPSVIFGPEDEFVNALARIVRVTPLLLPVPGGGSARFQPVHVDDVAAAVVRSVASDSTAGHRYEIGGPLALSLREMTERILVAMQAHRVIVPVPLRLARAAVSVVQRLVPNLPVTPELLDLLALDNTVEHNALAPELGVTPTPFAVEELYYLRRITFRDALASLFTGSS